MATPHMPSQAKQIASGNIKPREDCCFRCPPGDQNAPVEGALAGAEALQAVDGRVDEKAATAAHVQERHVSQFVPWGIHDFYRFE